MSVRLEFGILGPLEVREHGALVPVGGPRQRALLALLLCNANQVVSRDRLIDELLSDRSPSSADRMLRVQISRLRKVLAAVDPEPRVISRSTGYVLRVDADELDLQAFERRVEEGREALERGDPGEAAAAFRGAESLWRGGPLADLESEPFVRLEAHRLEELRLSALEDRVDVDLALGRHAALCVELEMLVAEHPLRERLRAQLMLALYRCGRQAEALAVYRQTSELLREHLGLAPSPALRELERSILTQDSSLDHVSDASRLNGAGRRDVCPFKGLAFFDRADEEFFCGRDGLVSDLVTRLAEFPLVGILGPSGIGKSSLLRAGLLPALSGGVLPGSEEWPQLLLRPGEDPLAELARKSGSGGLNRALARLSPGERIVVAVDQLEELFSVCTRDDQRAAFLEQLAAAARDDERRALVVVALRADFYDRLASYSRFAGLLSRSHLLVGPMDRQELASAIEQPANRVGLRVERGLCEALVDDVAGEPGGLPLLSTMLLELWRARDDHKLRYESYRRSGGVHGAVARLAEDAYGQLDETQRCVARGVLLRLVSDEEGALVRRRVPVGELQSLTGAEQVLAALIQARLLTASDGEIEVSHEALLREWPRYRGLLEEDRAGRRLHVHLAVAAREWDTRGRDPSELYRGARLTGALEWAAQPDDQLTTLEREFIDSSRSEAEREARGQRSQNRRLRGLLLGIGALLLVAVIAGVIALIKQHSASSEARIALARQLGAQAVSEPRLDRAMLLAREAVNLDRSPQTEGSLLATLLRSPAASGTFALPVNSASQLVLSPDGRTLAASALFGGGYFAGAGTIHGEVRFYDARTHASTRAPLRDFGGARPVYSSDGSLLVYPTQDYPEWIAVRDAHTLALRANLAFDPSQIALYTPDLAHAAILISPDRRSVYCAYRVFDSAHNLRAEYVSRWSLQTSRRLSTKQIGATPFLAVGLLDKGARLLAVDARNISVYDATSLRRLGSVPIRPVPVAPSAAGISPDGRQIAIASPNGRIWFVDSLTGDSRPGLGVHGSSVTNLAYSQDGRALVVTGKDDTVTVWNPRTVAATETLTAPAGGVQGLAFSYNGSTLYTSSPGGVGIQWDLTGSRGFGQRAHLGSAPRCCGALSPPAPPLALSPNGSSFAAAIGASTVGLFSVHTLQRQGSFKLAGKGSEITALAWSPTGSELAVAGHSGLMQLWRVNGQPRLLRSLIGLQPLVGQPGAIQALGFSPRGSILAATSNDNNLQSLQSGTPQPAQFQDHLARLALWSASTGKLLSSRDLGTGPAPYDMLAFSPDGKLLAVSLLDGTVQILDPSTGQIRRTLHPLGIDDTASLAFARDGTLATGTLNGIVQLWNPIGGEQVTAPLSVTAGPVSSIAFDPTGQRFATAGAHDGTAKLWNTATLQQEGTALNTDQGHASSARFVAGAGSLLVITNHGNAFTWPMTLAAWKQRACSIAGRNLSPQEWARYIPTRSYTQICP